MHEVCEDTRKHTKTITFALNGNHTGCLVNKFYLGKKDKKYGKELREKDEMVPPFIFFFLLLVRDRFQDFLVRDKNRID